MIQQNDSSSKVDPGFKFVFRPIPSGIYFARLHCRYAGQARLVTPEYTKSIKMLLLK